MFEYRFEVLDFNPKTEAVRSSWGIFPNRGIAQIMCEALNKKFKTPNCTFFVKEIV
tara:strand:- start:768 stop:935 length:168 start_codon:yes stop_codon:yes gene_type:complete